MKVWLPLIRAGSGSDVYTMRLAEGLRRHGVESEITSFDRYFEFAPKLLAGVAPPPGCDVVLANSWNAFAFRRPGLPLVAVEHGFVLDPLYRPYKTRAQHRYHSLLIRRYELASFAAADRVIACSHFTAEALGRTLGLRDVEVIWNWGDTERFSPGEPHVAAGPFKLLFVGNPTRRKGVDLLAPIMQALGAAFELRVTGGLRAYDGEGRWPSNVTFIGKLDERAMIEEYRNCDALLFPSRYEGFGYAALEAMACGKPVVATHAAALPEIVADRQTGLLCPPDNVGAFVAACLALARDRTRAREMGACGRERACEQFAPEIILPRYVELFSRLTENDHAVVGRNRPTARMVA